MTDYEEIKHAIENCPVTFLPALIAVAVETSIKKGIWSRQEGLQKFLNNIIWTEWLKKI
jgi:hypothetical protein